MRSLTKTERSEAKIIHILFKVVAEAEDPLTLSWKDKGSLVMQCLVLKRFHAAQPQLPILQLSGSRDLAGLLVTGYERQGHAIKKEQCASMEDKKQEGYF